MYKQIIRFFDEEKITDKFEIAFVTIKDGVVTSNSQLATRKNYGLLPPKHFRSGQSGVTQKQIENMADSIVEYLKANRYLPADATHQALQAGKLKAPPIAYVRGSYLEAVKQANRLIGGQVDSTKDLKTCRPIDLMFSDDELAQLKKKGIMWMKIGLRMPAPFIIFKMKLKYIIADSIQKEKKQLKLF